jgi:hypothetical protein
MDRLPDRTDLVLVIGADWFSVRSDRPITGAHWVSRNTLDNVLLCQSLKSCRQIVQGGLRLVA